MLLPIIKKILQADIRSDVREPLKTWLHVQPQGSNTVCQFGRLHDPFYAREPSVWELAEGADLFSPSVPFEFVDQAFSVMARAGHHEFRLITRHVDRALQYLRCWRGGRASYGYMGLSWGESAWPLPNLRVIDDQGVVIEGAPESVRLCAA